MATVYVKSVDASSWSRTTWDNSGGTNYVVGDRVIKAIADGSSYENLGKTYVCIVDNNSTTDPETDTTNWARVGFSEEYPFHAPGGNLVSTANTGEVYLDGLNTRYKGTSDLDRSFWHHVQNFGADSEGTVIFLNGTYSTASPIPGDKINYVAQNQGKVTVNVNTSNIFSYNDGYFNLHEGINYQIGGNGYLFNAQTRTSFKNCTITDENSIYGNYINAGVGLGYQNFVEFENCLINLPNAYTHIAGYNVVQGPDGRDALWKNTTVVMKFGNGNQYEPYFYSTGANSPITLEKCVFYIVSHVYSDAHNFMGSGVKATDSIAFSADNNLPEVTSSNSGLVIKDPLFVDGSSGDFRLRPSSPLIGGGESSKFPADAVWMQEGSGTGTGTESDPYYFSQFTDALIAAVSTNSKQVVCKDGMYRFTKSDAQLADANLGLVTFVAENRHKAWLSGEREINHGSKSSLTLKLKDFKLTIGSSEHFIHTSFVTVPSHITFDNCYINFLTFMGLKAGSSLIAKSCIIEKAVGITATSYFVSGTGSSGLYTNCTFIDRNDYTITTGWNHSVTAGMQTFRNCIFRTENTSNAPAPGHGTFIQCIAHNYNTSNYSDTEVLDANPLMVNYDISSHEDSDYRLRPGSLGVGGIKAEESNIYYLQPGNAYNGDGSQKDASAMTANGEAGPFNSFTNVRAANIPFNSKVIIINGTYSWPSELSPPYANIGAGGPSTGYEGYNYIAESPKSVIFDASGAAKYIVCNPKINNAHADLDTTFNGIVFKDSWTNFYNNMTRAAINTWTDTQGQGSLTFDRCSFQNWQILSASAAFIGHQMYGEKGIDITFTGCTMSFAFDGGGGLFGNYHYGGNTLEGVHTYKNNTIVVKGAGTSSVGGRNAINGYSAPTTIFSSAENTQKIFEGNILFIENNSSKAGNFTGTYNTASKFPQLKNNLFYDVNFGASESVVSVNNLFDIDPLFVDTSSNNFSLRPNSPLIGKG